MRFPNKVTSYEKSVISKFPIILKELKDNELTPNKLYEKVKKKAKFKNIKEFTEVLDCLFILDKIELTEYGVIRYVEKN